LKVERRLEAISDAVIYYQYWGCGDKGKEAKRLDDKE
jgi:hypothetical protein